MPIQNPELARRVTTGLKRLTNNPERQATVINLYAGDAQRARIAVDGRIRECIMDTTEAVYPGDTIYVKKLEDDTERYTYERYGYAHPDNDERWFEKLLEGNFDVDMSKPSGPLPGLRIPLLDVLTMIWVYGESGPFPPVVDNSTPLLEELKQTGDPESFEWFIKPRQNYRKVHIGGTNEATKDDPNMDHHEQSSFGEVWDRPQTYGAITWNADRFRTRRAARFTDYQWLYNTSRGHCAGSILELAQQDYAYYLTGPEIPEVILRPTATPMTITAESWFVGSDLAVETNPNIGRYGLAGNVFIFGDAIWVYTPPAGAGDYPGSHIQIINKCGANGRGGAWAMPSPWSGNGDTHEYGITCILKGNRNHGYQGIINLAQAPIEILAGYGGVFSVALYDNDLIIGTSDNFFSIGLPDGTYTNGSQGWHKIARIANGDDSVILGHAGMLGEEGGVPAIPGSGLGLEDPPSSTIKYGGITYVDLRFKAPSGGQPGYWTLHQQLEISSTVPGTIEIAGHQITYGENWEDLGTTRGVFTGVPMGGYPVDSLAGYVLSSANDMVLKWIGFRQDGAYTKFFPLDYMERGAESGNQPNPGYPGEHAWTYLIKKNPFFDPTKPADKKKNPKIVTGASLFVNVPGSKLDPVTKEVVEIWDDPHKTKWFQIRAEEVDFDEIGLKHTQETILGLIPDPGSDLAMPHHKLGELGRDDHPQYITKERLLEELAKVSVSVLKPITPNDTKLAPEDLDRGGYGPGPEWPFEDYITYGGIAGLNQVIQTRYKKKPDNTEGDGSAIVYDKDGSRYWQPVVDRRGDTMTGQLVAPELKSSTDRLIIASNLTPVPTPTVLLDHSGNGRHGTIVNGHLAEWKLPSLLQSAGPNAASAHLKGAWLRTPLINGLSTYTIEVHFAWPSSGGTVFGSPNHYTAVSSVGMDDDTHMPIPGPPGGSGYFTTDTFGNPVQFDGFPDAPPVDYPYIGDLQPIYEGLSGTIYHPHNMLATVADAATSTFKIFQMSPNRGTNKWVVQSPGWSPTALQNATFAAIYNGTGVTHLRISEIVVWDRALGGNEVNGNYQYGSFTSGTQWEDRIKESKPYAWYRFQEGTRAPVKGEISLDESYLYTHGADPSVYNGFRKIYAAPIEGIVTPGRYVNAALTVNDTGNIVSIEPLPTLYGDDDLTSQINGTKWTFATSQVFQAGTLEVVYNGLALRPFIDFNETNDLSGFELDVTIPQVGDSLYVRYTVGDVVDALLGITTSEDNYPGFYSNPEYLTDGNDATAATTAKPDFWPITINCDLGSPRTIFKMRLLCSDPLRRPTGWVLQSNDGGGWTTRLSVSANQDEHIHTFTPVTARYWRLTFSSTVGGNVASLNSLSLYAMNQ